MTGLTARPPGARGDCPHSLPERPPMSGPGLFAEVLAHQVPPADVRRVQGLPEGGQASRQQAAVAAAPHR